MGTVQGSSAINILFVFYLIDYLSSSSFFSEMKSLQDMMREFEQWDTTLKSFEQD